MSGATMSFSLSAGAAALCGRNIALVAQRTDTLGSFCKVYAVGGDIGANGGVVVHLAVQCSRDVSEGEIVLPQWTRMVLGLKSGDAVQIQNASSGIAAATVASQLDVEYLGHFLPRNYDDVPFPTLTDGRSLVLDDIPLDQEKLRHALLKDGVLVERGCVIGIAYYDSLVVLRLVDTQSDHVSTCGPETTVNVRRPRQLPLDGFTQNQTAAVEDAMSDATIAGVLPALLPRAQQQSGWHVLPSSTMIAGLRGSGKSHILSVIASCVEKYAPGATIHYLTLKDLVSEHGDGSGSWNIRELTRATEGDGQESVVAIFDDIDLVIHGLEMSQSEDAEPALPPSILAARTKLLDVLASAADSDKITVVAAVSVQSMSSKEASSFAAFWRHPRRFQTVRFVPLPEHRTREKILSYWLATLPRDGISLPAPPANIPPPAPNAGGDQLSQAIAGITAGYLPSDLVRVCAKLRTYHMSEHTLEWADVLLALGEIYPRELRNLDVRSFAGQLSWDDFGGYQEAKERLKNIVKWQLASRLHMARLGVERVPGIVMHGPSGCGKTFLAQVIAAESNMNLIWVRSTELLSSYFGETEATIRQLFSRARLAAPCILFFDEFDAIAMKRGLSGDQGQDAGSVHFRVLSTLLNEIDGVSGQTTGLLVLAATSRLDDIDEALLRPGRLQEKVFLGPPQAEDLTEILRKCTRNMPVDATVDFEKLGQRCFEKGYVGAHIEELCREAILNHAKDEDFSVLSQADFDIALEAMSSQRQSKLVFDFGSGI